MLEASQIECVRGSRRLFSNLSFGLEPHQALRVMGDNGAGKTSLLRIIAGLSPVESGQVNWKGGNIRTLGEAFRCDLVFLGHANGLKDDLTAFENLRQALRLAGIEAKPATLWDVLAAHGLGSAANLPVKLLSQGQKRRVALVRLAFCAGKPLWILDEPFSALDAASVARLAAVLATHAQRGGMVIFTTHQDVELPGAAVRTLGLGSARA